MASSQAEPDTEVKRLVKVSVFLKKKPGITDEEFHRYWSEKHAPLLSSFPIFQEKILKYTQYHNDMALTSKAASLMGGVPTIEFDGAAEFWVTDLDSLFSVWFNQEFLKVVQPDEQNFVSHENLKIMIGYEDVTMDRT